MIIEKFSRHTFFVEPIICLQNYSIESIQLTSYISYEKEKDPGNLGTSLLFVKRKHVCTALESSHAHKKAEGQDLQAVG